MIHILKGNEMTTTYFVDLDQLSQLQFKTLLPRIASHGATIRVYAADQRKYKHIKKYGSLILGKIIFVNPGFVAHGKEFVDKLIAIDVLQEVNNASKLVIVSNDADHIDALRYVAGKTESIDTELRCFDQRHVKRNLVDKINTFIADRVFVGLMSVAPKNKIIMERNNE